MKRSLSDSSGTISDTDSEKKSKIVLPKFDLLEFNNSIDLSLSSELKDALKDYNENCFASETKIGSETIFVSDNDQVGSIQRQVIQKSFAMIKRSNTSDWNFEGGDNIMLLAENCIITVDDRDLMYSVITEILHDDDITCILIKYKLSSQFDEIKLFWKTSECSDPTCNKCDADRLIVRYNIESWWFWEEEKTYTIYPENTIEDNWCYFYDSRDHLNRLAWFDQY